MERRESSIKSQLSDMVYNASLDDLDQADNGVPSELYRINVFGKNITIAPGKPKKNPKYPGIVYFYIYVIKGGSAIAKLGVYEKKTTEILEMYDLTTFPEGSLMLFDLYYNEPVRINVFEEEVRLNVNKENKEIFNYLAKYIPVNNANIGILKQQIAKLKQLKMKSGLKYPKTKNNDIRTRIMEVFDIFGQEPVIDLVLLTKLSIQVKPDMRMFALFILEYILSLRFIFINNDNSLLNEDDMREIKVAGQTEPIKKYIVVSLDEPPVFIMEHDYSPGEDIKARIEEIKQEHEQEPESEPEQLGEEEELDLDELSPKNNESFNKEAEAIKEEEKNKTQNVANNSKKSQVANEKTNKGSEAKSNNSINSKNSSIYDPGPGLEQIELRPLDEGLSLNSNNSNEAASLNRSNSESDNAKQSNANNNGSNTSSKSNNSKNAMIVNKPENATLANANNNGSNTSAKSNNSSNATSGNGNNSFNETIENGNSANQASNSNNSEPEETTNASVGGSKIKRRVTNIKIKK
jgi:hypothetical protein